MALIPKNAYPAQTLTTDPAYPQGKARNATVLGDGTGTPFEQQWVNDVWGFQQALLDEAGIVPNGSPDSVGASQYLAAIQALMVPKITGPVSSTDNEIPRFDGTTGNAAQGSGITVDDSKNVAGINDLTISGDITFVTPKVRTRLLHGASGSPDLSSSSWLVGNGPLSAQSNNAKYRFALSDILPDGATITQVRAKVNPGTNQVGSNNCEIQLRYLDPTMDDTATPMAAGTIVATAFTADNNINTQIITLSGLNETLDNGSRYYSLILGGSSGAATTEDDFYGVEVTFMDPGPRNY